MTPPLGDGEPDRDYDLHADEPGQEVEHVDPQQAAHPALLVGGIDLDLIRRTIAPDLTDGELALFGQVCNRTGLDPFARQIYATKRGGKMVIQTGIDGYRLIARRTRKMRGRLGPYFAANDGNGWRIGPDGKPLPWLDSSPPAAAMVGVLHADDDEPTWGIATWAEYAITGTGDAMWRKMPSTMLAKCAEAQAIRGTFPAETSGLYTEEEMAQAGPPDRAGRAAPSSSSSPAGGRVDPWNAKPGEVAAELRRRNLPVAGRIEELRQRLADALAAEGGIIDLPSEEAGEPAQDAQEPAEAPPAAAGPQEAATAPEEPEEVVVRYCANPECDADLDETGSLITDEGEFCPDHQP